MLHEEKEKLRKTNPLTIIDYIKNSIDILIDLKVEEKLEAIKKLNISDEEEKQNEYEVLLRKLESDIRLHIKIEHQLKLHSEALQQKIEDLEKDNEDSHTRNKHLSEKARENIKDKKDEEIQNLKNNVENLKQILKSYEEQSLKMSDLEKKLRNQNIKHEKELKLIEDKYAEKIKILDRKVTYYEETLKVNNLAYKSFKQEEDEFSKLTSLLSNERNSENRNAKKSPISTRDYRKNQEDSKGKSDKSPRVTPENKFIEVSNSNSNMNKSLLKKTTLNSNYDRNNTNKSYIHEEKASMNDSSKSYMKNDNFAKSLGNNAKKLLMKDSFKTHTKTFSMDIRNEKSKSPVPTVKTINSITDILKGNLNNSSNLNNSQNIVSNLAKNSQSNTKSNLAQQHANYRTTKSSNFITKANYPNNLNGDHNALSLNANYNKPILTNNKPSAVNSASNINISNNLNSYTTNGNVKSEINLRNYIMNRVNKSSGKPGSSQGKNTNALTARMVSGSGHFRSNSNNIFS